MSTGKNQAAVEPRPLQIGRTVAAAPGTRLLRAAAFAFATAGIAACGGGGGGGSSSTGGSSTAGSVATITAFPLQAAYRAFLVAGSAQRFAVSGDCSGTATLINEPSVAATFDGAAAVAVASGSDFSLPGCATPVSGSISVRYFDASYRALGSASVGGGVGRYTAPTALPDFVGASDSGTLGTELLYTDASRTTAVGKTVLSYSVLPDTATSVLTRLTTQTYDAADRLLVVTSATYRLGADGSFAAAGLDIANLSGTALHLVLTPQP